MSFWRRLLLVAFFLLAQGLAGAHAVEHAAGGEEGLPPHVCVLCLATQDLGAALPSLPPVLPLAVAETDPGERLTAVCPALPAPLPCQRGPPRT